MESTQNKNKNPKKIVIIPTYNEKDNIADLVAEIFSMVPDVHILVIDDSSPDGTATIVRNLQNQYPYLKLLERPGKLGLGTAYIMGFKYALEHHFDYIMEMDADFSHDPASLENFFLNIEKYDLVIGSRYIRGGRLVNWPIVRFLLSFFASLYVRLVTGLPLHDTTAGFKCFRREVLQSINLNEIVSEGYAFQIEMHYKAWQKGWRLKEIPITFVDRTFGQSKMSNKIIWEAFLTPWKLRLAPIFNYIKTERPWDLEDIDFQ